jgi:hypothetical protein
MAAPRSLPASGEVADGDSGSRRRTRWRRCWSVDDGSSGSLLSGRSSLSNRSGVRQRSRRRRSTSSMSIRIARPAAASSSPSPCRSACPQRRRASSLSSSRRIGPEYALARERWSRLYGARVGQGEPQEGGHRSSPPPVMSRQADTNPTAREIQWRGLRGPWLKLHRQTAVDPSAKRPRPKGAGRFAFADARVVGRRRRAQEVPSGVTFS